MAVGGGRRGLLVVLAGPSGSGKTTLLRALLGRLELAVESVSATTRPPRRGETDGVDYFFMAREKFMEDVRRGLFAEHAEVFGRNLYGTPKRFLDENLAAGRDVLMDVDVQGMSQLRHSYPDGAFIAVLPPSEKVLAERLAARGTDGKEEIARRLAESRGEVARLREECGYVVVNDRIEGAVEDLVAIVAAEKCRVTRRWESTGWKT